MEYRFISLAIALQSLTRIADAVNASRLSCPELLCEEGNVREPYMTDLCFEHDQEQPAKYFRAYTCDWYQAKQALATFKEEQLMKEPDSGVLPYTNIDGTTFCEFDLTSGEYAWVDEETQTFTTAGEKENSQLMNKRTEAYCRPLNVTKMNLNNGRKCSNSWECKSMNCSMGECKGLSEGEQCNNHVDCNPGLYCQVRAEWPFNYECAKQQTVGQECSETEDCRPNLFCWFETEQDRVDETKKCMELYSQVSGVEFGWYMEGEEPVFNDYQANGRYCTSGLAFQKSQNVARCTRTEHIEFDGEAIDAPYLCDPTDNAKRCSIRFNTTDYIEDVETPQAYIETSCKCALDGDNGFCGSVIGTSVYEDSNINLKKLLDQNDCHTSDRNDLRAYKEPCANSLHADWEQVVSQRFNITHWPYVNAGKNVPECIEKTFSDSLTNLSLEHAHQLLASSVSAIALLFAVTL